MQEICTIIGVFKSCTMMWVRYLASMEKIRNAYKVSVMKPEG